MRTRNPKRVKQEKEYREVCNKIDRELQKAGKLRCFFTDKPIPIEYLGIVFHHHLKGRDGDLLTDKKWIVPCLFIPHSHYHSLSVDKLSQLSWYAGFLKRLKEKDEKLYQKELDKKSKTLWDKDAANEEFRLDEDFDKQFGF